MNNEEMREKVSNILGVRYVVVDRHFVTQPGVAFSFQEVEENTPENIKRMYKERLSSGDIYDYTYAKTTGFLRRKKGYFKEYSVADTDNKNSVVNLFGFGSLIFFLVAALITVGVGAIYMSFRYTSQYLQEYLDKYSAMILSFTMAVFATSAFEVAVILWQHHKARAMPSILLALWFCVTVFSMNSTMAVNYNGYRIMKQQSLEAKSEENSGRLLLPVIDEQINTVARQIDVMEQSINNYIGTEGYSEWRASVMRKELEELVSKRDVLVVEKKEILSKTPEAAIIEDTTERTYFDSVAEITNMKPETFSFILNAFPAIFIDLIAPFSFAAALMLLGDKKKKGVHNA